MPTVQRDRLVHSSFVPVRDRDSNLLAFLLLLPAALPTPQDSPLSGHYLGKGYAQPAGANGAKVRQQLLVTTERNYTRVVAVTKTTGTGEVGAGGEQAAEDAEAQAQAEQDENEEANRAGNEEANRAGKTKTSVTMRVTHLFGALPTLPKDKKEAAAVAAAAAAAPPVVLSVADAERLAVALQVQAAKKDNLGAGSAAPFSVYPCTPFRINPGCLHPAGRAPGFEGCCYQCDGDGIAVEGRFGLAMVLAVVTVLLREDRLAPLLLDTLVARVKAQLSKGGLFAADAANFTKQVAALMGCTAAVTLVTVRALIALLEDTGLLHVTVDSNQKVNEHQLKGRDAPAALAANAAPEAAARAKTKLEPRFAPIMVGMALSPDDSRALLDVLTALHSNAAFRNRVQLLCPAWFAGVLCHTKEAAALETELRAAGDDASADQDDADDELGEAQQAELDAAPENDAVAAGEAAEAAEALPLFPAVGVPAAAAAAAAGAAAAAHAGHVPFASWPPRGPA